MAYIALNILAILEEYHFHWSVLNFCRVAFRFFSHHHFQHANSMIILLELRFFFLNKNHRLLALVLVYSVTSVWSYLDQGTKGTGNSIVDIAFTKVCLPLPLLKKAAALLVFQNSFGNSYEKQSYFWILKDACCFSTSSQMTSLHLSYDLLTRIKQFHYLHDSCIWKTLCSYTRLVV